MAEASVINPKSENLPTSFVYIDLESVSNGHLSKEVRISKNEAPSRAQRKLQRGDVLFQMVRPYQKNNLYFDKEGEYVASTGYAQIRTTQNAQFIFQYFHNQKFVDRVMERCTGTSYPAISSSDLGSIHIYQPEINEQQKIAQFLELLDSRIQTQNKIIENLKAQMLGLQEQIFRRKIELKDKKGNNFPEWEFKNGGDLFFSHTNKNHNSDLPILAITQEQGAVPRDLIDYQVSVTDKSVGSYKVVEVGDFIISLRSFQGGIEHSNYYGLCSPAYIILKNKIDVEKMFYKYYFKTSAYVKLLNQKLEGIRDGKMISYGYFSEIALPYPTIEEQKSIAMILSSFENKIKLERRIIEEYGKQKTYILKHLFI